MFIGSGLVVQPLHDRESGGGRELSTWRAVADYRYTPATHWVLGLRAPWVLDRSLEGPEAGEVSASGVGDLSFRLNTEGDGGYRFGNEMRLNLDLEYILFPLEYRRPGNEVFVLLETTIRRKWADEVVGLPLERTERTDLLVAPAVQHIVSEQLLASLSVQLPVVSDAPPGGLERDLDVLAELRYAF